MNHHLSSHQTSIASPAQPPQHKSRTWYRLLLLVILLVAFGLYLHDLTYQDIWWDEARNIDVALRPIAQVATAPELDIHPPLYFWLLHLWSRAAGIQLGQPAAVIAYLARFFSAAAGLCAVALLYPLGRRLHSHQAGLFALAFAALSPFWLAESQETRMYTLSFALLTAAAWVYLQNLDRSHPAPNGVTAGARSFTVPNVQLILHYLLFTFLSAAALWTHYNAIFILVAWYGWWGITVLIASNSVASFWQRLRPPLCCGIATILLFLPILPIALRQIPTYANPNLTIPTLGAYLWQNWQVYLGGYALDPTTIFADSRLWLWLIFAITIGGLILPFLMRTAHHPSRSTPPFSLFSHWFPLIWLVGGLALYYIAVLDRGAFNVRYSSFVTPPLYLLLGMALANWARLWRPFLVVGLGFLLIGVVPAIRADLYDSRFAREDIGDLTAWLRQEAGPNDLILVDQKYPFGFYYQRYAIDADQTPTGPEAAPARYLFVDVNTLDAVLNSWAGQVDRVFWVQWFESDTDPRHAVRFLLDIYGERAGERTFQGYDVDWWTLTPPTTFALPSTWIARTLRFADAVQTTELAFPAQVAIAAKVPVAIRWQRVRGGVVERPLKARIALYDAQGNRIAQADERLLNDRHRLPAEWDDEEQPLNLYLLETPAGLAAGSYELRLLVYDADTLEPLSFLDEADNPAGIEEVLGEVVVGQ
ncbi:MAG: glycosyltransferase family 39 protein [Caldilineaceae bacterium]